MLSRSVAKFQLVAGLKPITGIDTYNESDCGIIVEDLDDGDEDSDGNWNMGACR